MGSNLRCVGIDVEWRAVMRKPGKSAGGAGEGSILQVPRASGYEFQN